jgi:hypothetical protein
MSHNLVKVDGQVPSKEGQVNLNLADFTDLGSFADGEVLVYDSASAEWAGASPVATRAPSASVLVGRGESVAYSTNGQSLAANQTFCVYDSAPLNNISSSVTINKIGSTNWVQSYTLGVGKYELYAQFGAKFSATGELVIAWDDASGNKRSSMAVQPNPTARAGASTNAVGYINVESGTVTVRLRIYYSTNATTADGGLIAQSSMVAIRKLA